MGYLKPSQETAHATSAPAAGTAFDQRRIHSREDNEKVQIKGHQVHSLDVIFKKW